MQNDMHRKTHSLEIAFSDDWDMEGAEMAAGFGTNMEQLHFGRQIRYDFAVRTRLLDREEEK